MRISVNGISVNYAIEGRQSAPVVTLSHSLSTDYGMWDAQAEILARDYRVLRYDTRGHGGTSAPKEPYTLDQLAEDASQLLAALGIERTHFVGLSMGGMIGQTLALKQPGLFQGLVLCDTSSRVPKDAVPMWQDRIKVAQSQGMEALVEPTMARWFSKAFMEAKSGEANRIRDMIRNTPVAGYVGCCSAIAKLDLTDRLPALHMPTQIIVGADDPSTPVAASEAMHEKIAGSELVVLPSALHLANVEQADEFNAALSEFLGRH